MRGFWFLLAAVLVAIGAGVGIEAAQAATGPKSTFRSAIDTIGASSTIEIGFGLDVPGGGAAGREVRAGTFEVDLSSVNGQPLAGQPSSATDEQISISEGGAQLAALRVDQDTALYVRVDLAAIGALASLPAQEKSTLRAIGGLIGPTWFAIPSAVINSIENTARNLDGHAPTALSTSKDEAAVGRWKNDLLAVAHFSSSSVAGASTASAEVALSDFERLTVRDLGGLVGSLAPIGGAIGRGEQQAARAAGSVSVTVVDNPSGTLRSGVLAVVAGHEEVTVDATVGHRSIDLGPPPSAVPLPPAISRAIERLIGGRLFA